MTRLEIQDNLLHAIQLILLPASSACLAAGDT